MVTRDQLRAAGVSSNRIDGRIANGLLIAVYPGVYYEQQAQAASSAILTSRAWVASASLRGSIANSVWSSPPAA